jgi:hypothetical protein
MNIDAKLLNHTLVTEYTSTLLTMIKQDSSQGRKDGTTYANP